MASSSLALRPLFLLPLAALASLTLLGEAKAGICPLPACIQGEVLPPDGGSLPQNAPGVAYRLLQGPFVPRPVPDAGPDAEPVPPGRTGPRAVLLGPDGKELEANTDDDAIDERYKVLKPAGGLRPGSYRVRFDQNCATGTSPMPESEITVNVTGQAPPVTKTGDLTLLGQRIVMLDVPNPDDAGPCTVKQEVSAVKVRLTPSAELLPYVRVVGYKASLDGEDNVPLRYGNAGADGTFEAEVYALCPTQARQAKVEITARIVGASGAPPVASLDVTLLPCIAGDGGADGGRDAGSASTGSGGCACDTSSTGNSTGAGLSFGAAVLASAFAIRATTRRRKR